MSIEGTSTVASSAPVAPTRNGAAVVGFIAGLVSALFCVNPLMAWPLGILGVVASLRGRKAAATGAPWGGLATAGLVLGVIGIVVGSLIFLFLFPFSSATNVSTSLTREGHAFRR